MDSILATSHGIPQPLHKVLRDSVKLPFKLCFLLGVGICTAGMVMCALVFEFLRTLAWLLVCCNLWRRYDCDQPINSWLASVLVISSLTFHIQRRLVKFGLQSPASISICLPSLCVIVCVTNWLVTISSGHWLLSHSTSCKETSPWLFSFAEWYLFFALPACVLETVCCILSTMLATLLLYLTRHGYLTLESILPFISLARSSWGLNGSDPATIDSMEVVTDLDLDTNLDVCCICYAEHSSSNAVVRTPCGHLMHKECLRPWLSISHTCPMCRANLEHENHIV